MKYKIKTKTFSVMTEDKGIILKWTWVFLKVYWVRLIELFEVQYGSHFKYVSLVKYVIKKSKNQTCIEIDLL